MKVARPLLSVHGWIILCVVLMVAVTSGILWNRAGIYISPDETANSLFAQKFAQTGTLSLDEPRNEVFMGKIHPRSTRVIGDRIVPSGFLGLPIMYGSAVAVVGALVLWILTPLLAALGTLAFYAIVRRLFENKTLAVLSTILLASHPAWWYYTSRSLMPNVPFLALLLIGCAFLYTRPFVVRWRWFSDLLGGFMIGAALAIRPSELPWIAIGAVCLLFYKRALPAWRSIIVFTLGSLIVLVPVFAVNIFTYGSPWTTGYHGTSSELLDFSDRPSDERSSFLPWAIDPLIAFSHARAYLFQLFWWLVPFAAIGASLFLTSSSSREEKTRKQHYLVFCAAIGLFLVIFYGSWTFADNPNPKAISIANSYVRYWLPLFVLSSPLIAEGILWLAQLVRSARLYVAIIVVLTLSVLAGNIHATFFAREDGLVQVADTLARSQEIRERVFAITPEEAIIIVDRADKMFFPQRRVIVPLRDESTFAIMPKLTTSYPLYYYGVTFPEGDFQYLQERKLKELDLSIEFIETFDAESLYQIRQSL